MTPGQPQTVDVRPETAPVRPGEELPWDRLARWLVPALADVGVDVEGDMAVAQFPNGSANLTYLLTFGDHRFVLRRPPFGAIAPGAHDMKREYRVLSKLWRSFDRAPRAYSFCDDHDVVGSDFVVSEYRRGEVIWATLPSSVRDLPDAARRIGFATVDAVAELHLVDPEACGLGELGRPDGYMARQLAGWRHRWSLVATPDLDGVMSALGERLERTLPASPAPTIVHNDFKLDNCQFRPGEPDRVWSVFDWDQATLGDPLADVGMLLNYWPDPSDTDGDRPLHVPGMEELGLPSRAEVIGRYAAATGADLSGVAWYEAFATWKNAVVTQQLHQRYVRGESTDERMAAQAAHPPRLAARTERLLADLPGGS